MIQRPKTKIWNGVRRDHQGQKNHACPSQKWIACLRSTLIPWALFIKSGFPLDRQSILLQRHSWKTQKQSHTGSSKHCHKLDPASRQCASPCSVLCSAVFDIQMHYGDAAASLFTGPRSLRLLIISKSKIGNERTPFWTNRRHPEVCNAGRKRHSSSCVPGMLQTVAAPLENVCAGTRDVLWRWPYFSLWINKIKLFFFNQSHHFTVGPRMHYDVSHSKTKHCAQKLYLCVPRAAYNRQRQFPYTALFHSFKQMRRSKQIMRFGTAGTSSVNYHRYLTNIKLIPFWPSQDDAAAPGLEILVLLGYIPSSLGYCCPVFRDSVVTSASRTVDTAQYPKKKHKCQLRGFRSLNTRTAPSFDGLNTSVCFIHHLTI